ncbi:MAG: protein kinase [Pseudomonadota bacterium]
MAVSDKIVTTVVWAKQLTTGTFSTVTGQLLRNEFVNRNRKTIVGLVLLWLAVIVLGYWSLQSAVEKHRQQYLDTGVQASSSMSEKVSAPLLENDLLTLNIAISDLKKKINPVFAVILDHADKVLAHSDPEAMNKPLDIIADRRQIATQENIVIESGNYRGGKAVITFTNPLFFSKVNIGKIVFGLDANGLYDPISTYHTLFWVLFGVSTLLAAGGIFLSNIYLKKRAEKELEAFEKLNKVGPYMLKRKIAQGGMAELYLAEYVRDDGFKRTVAIKKILPHLAQNKDFVDMFIREARLAAMLQHPNIVQIFDLIKMHNASFMAMEYISGKNLAEIMAQEKKGLPVNLALFIIQKTVSGLHYSHSRQDDITGEPLHIVHRDISPQNILISFKGEVKISDFGISKAKSEPSLTQAGVIKGKLSYLSPEQALGKEVDHQADIYALGIIFHEILTGKRLYRFDNELEAIRTIPTMAIPPVKQFRPDVPDTLCHIVDKCLEKDKALRYQSGKDLHDDIVTLRAELGITFDASHLADFMHQRFDIKEE